MLLVFLTGVFLARLLQWQRLILPKDETVMEISGNTAFYAGLSSIQSGQNRVDQAASQIANTTIERSVTSQSSEAQVDRLRGVDRSQQMDPGSDMVQMAQGKFQVDLGAKVVKASDEVLGTIIDTFA